MSKEDEHKDDKYIIIYNGKEYIVNYDGDELEYEDSIEDLELDLKYFEDLEEYEICATLRDKITKLKNELK